MERSPEHRISGTTPPNAADFSSSWVRRCRQPVEEGAEPYNRQRKHVHVGWDGAKYGIPNTVTTRALVRREAGCHSGSDTKDET